MLEAACGIEIIPRFFVDFGGSKRIATEEKLHRCLVLLVLLVKMLASHLGGAHTVARLRVGVGGVIHRTRTLVEIGGFHMTSELEEQPRRIFPLLAALEHFRSLFEKPGALEGLPRKPAIFGELCMVGWRTRIREGIELVLQVAPIVLARSFVVPGLRANLRSLLIGSSNKY